MAHEQQMDEIAKMLGLDPLSVRRANYLQTGDRNATGQQVKSAIWLEETTVVDSKGNKVIVKQPHVDAELCIGCGICENKCPVSDKAAILVTSVGETRSLKNRFLLVDEYGG